MRIGRAVIAAVRIGREERHIEAQPVGEAERYNLQVEVPGERLSAVGSSASQSRILAGYSSGLQVVEALHILEGPHSPVAPRNLELAGHKDSVPVDIPVARTLALPVPETVDN